MSPFKIEMKTVPPFLRKLVKSIVDGINERAPIEGFGIEISEEPDGRRVEIRQPKAVDDATSGSGNPSGSSGTTVSVYGAFNGAPATFHLLQSSAPTPIP